MQDFRKLIVWEKAQELTLHIYKATRKFPTDEKFGLIAQMRSASSSMGANIADGCGRGSQREFLRYLYIATGSAFEIENHILLAQQLDYLDEKSAASLIEGVVEIKKNTFWSDSQGQGDMLNELKWSITANEKEG